MNNGRIRGHPTEYSGNRCEGIRTNVCLIWTRCTWNIKYVSPRLAKYSTNRGRHICYFSNIWSIFILLYFYLIQGLPPVTSDPAPKCFMDDIETLAMEQNDKRRSERREPYFMFHSCIQSSNLSRDLLILLYLQSENVTWIVNSFKWRLQLYIEYSYEVSPGLENQR